MRFAVLFILLAFPFAVPAQEDRASAPMLVGQDAPAAANPAPAVAAPLPLNFPQEAITDLGEHTTGQPSSQPPAVPISPTSPMPDVPANPPNPAAPAVPPAPASPISKLWPRDTVPIFMPACINYHPELIPACMCVITKLMVAMPHDEFLRESEAGTIESDPRLINVRTQCVTTPQRKE